MYDNELLAIVVALKTWKYYLKDFQHEVFIFTNHNNLQQFIDIKSLSFRQIYLAQELFRYHFRLDYC